MNLTEHFTKKEMACSCCGHAYMNKDFLDKLEEARLRANMPFKINSGYRCKNHKESLARPTSSHVLGVAVDIATPDSVTRQKIMDAIVRAGFTRYGVGKTFIHVDLDLNKPDAFWHYYGSH